MRNLSQQQIDSLIAINPALGILATQMSDQKEEIYSLKE
jgi:hypothetical protein